MAQRTVETDISNSRRAFTDIVWPKIQDKWFDGARLEPVEDETDSLKHAMDTIAGIDYWTVGDELEAIASRVQNGTDFSTFSVRMSRNTPGSGNETEYQKRLKAIESDALSPKWVIQAYVTADVATQHGVDYWVTENGKLQNVAIALEDELIKWCDNGKEGVHFGKNGTGGNTVVGEDEDFFYVHWSDYKKFDRHLRCHTSPNDFYKAPPLGTKVDPQNQPPSNQSTIFDHA